ncbi:hypothetical protein [Cyanobacterium aponinum]|uniref:Uncharacterized protein n=1 Tax=Cyanobacterium aponinum AL20115 TaxID=3090662 RepID=A0AAF1C4P4_9CHRO|nr:hypothetical protein [Cyanobacterium aponinum]WPF87551.1 hypothetical protein SAY89_12120 [Cyanobacterium aponinum AL20115]
MNNQYIDFSHFPQFVQDVLTKYFEYDLNCFQWYLYAQNYLYDQLGDSDYITDIELLLGF